MTHLFRTYMKNTTHICSCKDKILSATGNAGLSAYRAGNLESEKKIKFPRGEETIKEKVRLKKARAWKYGKTTEVIYEKLCDEDLESIRYVTGVSITPFNLGWAKTDLWEKRILEYDGCELEFGELTGMNENQLYDTTKDLRKILPLSDLYIMESTQFWMSSRKESITTIKIVAMLIAILNEESKDSRKVYVQSQRILNHLFNLKVRDERISAAQVLQRLLNKQDETETVTPESNPHETHNGILNITNTKLNIDISFLKNMYERVTVENDASALAFFLILSFLHFNSELPFERVTP